jgi:tetratricopeptide (TPR) repeat protein
MTVTPLSAMARERIPHITHRLGLLAADLGHLDEAQEHFDHARADYERSFGPDDYRVLQVEESLAWLLIHRGDYVNAEKRLLRNGQRLRAILGDTSALYAGNVYDLAFNAQSAGRLDEARRLYMDSAEVSARSTSALSPSRGWAMWAAAQIDLKQGKSADALILIAEIDKIWVPGLPPDSPVFGELDTGRAEALFAQGRPLEAAVAVRRAVASLERSSNSVLLARAREAQVRIESEIQNRANDVSEFRSKK